MTLMSTQKIRRNRMAVMILEMTQKMRMKVMSCRDPMVM